MSNNKISDEKNNIVRFTVRLSEDFYNEIKTNAKIKDMSVNDYVRNALYMQTKKDSKPVLEVERLNQLIDSVNGMSANLTCLENIIVDSVNNLMNLTTGDNYLLYDGED